MLRTPLHNEYFVCPDFHKTADPFGDHQIGCGGNGDQTSNHNVTRDILFSAAQSAVLEPSKDPRLVSQSTFRPADVLLWNWSNNCPAALDVQVISPLQSLTLSEAVFYQGHALQVGFQYKLAANLPNCRSSGFGFIPLVAETLRGLAEDFIATIKAIGQFLGLRSGSDRESDPTRHLFGQISLVLWRGNVLMFIHRSPTIPSTLDSMA